MKAVYYALLTLTIQITCQLCCPPLKLDADGTQFFPHECQCGLFTEGMLHKGTVSYYRFLTEGLCYKVQCLKSMGI